VEDSPAATNISPSQSDEDTVSETSAAEEASDVGAEPEEDREPDIEAVPPGESLSEKALVLDEESPAGDAREEGAEDINFAAESVPV
jgi:hypothetical protein